MYNLLIRNARIARPDGSTFEGDVACEDGRIARIDPAITAGARETIDAAGNLLLPGVIDPQVHFREPGNEHKEDLGSGSRAAVRGGVTSFLEMPNTAPPTTTQAALDEKLARAAQKSVANYGFFIGATPDNLEALNSVTPACGIKIFMGSSTGSLLVNRPEDLERIFANGTRLIAVHAEDEARIHTRRAQFAGRTDPAVHSEIRDNETARLATELALTLSKKYQRRLHILHLSTREEVAMLRVDKPAWVTAEVIPNHLLLNTGDYARLGTLVQMNPPIRSPQDNAALWAGLHDGIIDFIATDHAPAHARREKKGLPKHAVRHARGRNLAAADAHRHAGRPLHARRNPEMDVHRTGRGLPHSEQGQDSGRLGRRPHARRYRTHPAGAQRGNLYQGALVTVERP